MTGGSNLGKPELDIEATVERAMAVINRTLQPSLEEAQKAVGKARAGKPLLAPGDLVGQVTRENRIRAARAVSYSLPRSSWCGNGNLGCRGCPSRTATSGEAVPRFASDLCSDDMAELAVGAEPWLSPAPPSPPR